MRPVIAITVGEIINISTGKVWTPVVYGQFQTYTDAIVRAGGAPFILPLVDDEAALKRLYQQCDGLLLSGGHDLSQTSPGRPRALTSFNVSPRRDKQEVQLLKWALRDNKPVLGICRGMQLINMALGGDLHQDIDADLPEARNHQAGIHNKSFHHLAHQLDIKPESQLAKILKTGRVSANTLHHQAVSRLGDGLVATAYAEDGVIEAIELPAKKFVVGVQSHPEALEAETEPLWRALFTAFVSSSKVPSPKPARQ
jgi:putative glutamine amidotransferase